MYLLIVGAPMMGAMLMGLGGRYIGRRGGNMIGVVSTLIGGMVAILAGYEVVLCGAPTYIHGGGWIDIGDLTVDWGMQWDKVSAIMSVVVLNVSAVIQLYATGYMAGDPHVGRFMTYVVIFTALMGVLVTADNYGQLFIGWEGVGLCSYLLINYWGTRIQAMKAGIKAMVVNRVGDVGVMIGMMGMSKATGSLTYVIVDGAMDEGGAYYVSVMLLIGAMGKSAQVGMHIWLVEAMEGPTPVSALIHAATMVTAGVYMLIRASNVYEGQEGVMMGVAIVGAITAVLGGTAGLVQHDIKRVVAYSTSSQLGYMMAACGLGAYMGGLYHLANHALFKALLFMAAGVVIHATREEQDLRRYGALIRGLPVTYVLTLIGSMALMGVPYLAGYYSKERIIEESLGHYGQIGVSWLLMIGGGLTGAYSVRAIVYTYIGSTGMSKYGAQRVNEGSGVMLMAMVLLGGGSISVGYMGQWIFLGMEPEIVVGGMAKWSPVLGSLLGGILGGWAYKVGEGWIPGSGYGQMAYSWLISGWQYGHVVNKWLTGPLWRLGYEGLYKSVDRGLLEAWGPTGMRRGMIGGMGYISRAQSGRVYNYILAIVAYLGIGLLGNYGVDLIGREWRCSLAMGGTGGKHSYQVGMPQLDVMAYMGGYMWLVGSLYMMEVVLALGLLRDMQCQGECRSEGETGGMRVQEGSDSIVGGYSIVGGCYVHRGVGSRMRVKVGRTERGRGQNAAKGTRS